MNRFRWLTSMARRRSPVRAVLDLQVGGDVSLGEPRRLELLARVERRLIAVMRRPWVRRLRVRQDAERVRAILAELDGERVRIAANREELLLRADAVVDVLEDAQRRSAERQVDVAALQAMRVAVRHVERSIGPLHGGHRAIEQL